MFGDCVERRRREGGWALLIVLIAVAILMVLYFVDIRGIFGPTIPIRPSLPQERPWLDEERIVGDEGVVKLPAPPKPELDKPLTIMAGVVRNGKRRGTLTLDFGTDGRVFGSWSCSYTYDERKHTFGADFAGNVDVSKTYVDEKGKDRSKLYFISKGEY